MAVFSIGWFAHASSGLLPLDPELHCSVGVSVERQCEHGFTLIEVIVAIVVLATAAIGAAGLFGIALHSTRVARTQTWTAMLAADKLEQLRTLAWTTDEAGAAVSDTSADVSTDPATNGGPGLRISPEDALERNIAGYVDYLDSSGRWVGNGSGAPPEAVYVRRWSIQPLPDDPADTRILQVLVTSAGRPTAAAGAGVRVRGPGGASLVSLRTRTRQQ